jgi:uncharacterized linocin/CFP29 family protein
MDNNTTVWTPGVYVGSRPLRVNNRTGQVQVVSERGIVVNSLLRKDEWQLLDREIQKAATIRVTAVNDVKAKNLVIPIGSLGVLTTQFSQQSEMTSAARNMTGQATGERDRLEHLIKGRPIPITYKEFNIPKRQLEASRLLNTSLDTTTAEAAAVVVAESLQDLLVNGDTSVVFGGDTIYGYRTEPNRNTGTAAGLGGGDFGTLSNIIPTVKGMIAAVTSDRYYGKYILYLAPNQHVEVTTQFYSDGNPETPYERIMRIEQIEAVKACDALPDGEGLLIQMTKNVVDWAEHMQPTVVEWLSGDGMMAHFKVMAVATPRVKSDFNGNSGIYHVTGI